MAEKEMYEKEYLFQPERNIFKKIWYGICRIGWRFSRFCQEIKFAWQRSEKGYDDTMIWNLCDALPELIYHMLKEYNENRQGFPTLLNFNPQNYTEEDAKKDEEYWDNIVKEIIYHFQECNEETCSRQNPYEMKGEYYCYKEQPDSKFFNVEVEYATKEDEKETEQWLETSKELEEYMREHKKQGFEMLAKYIDYIWD